MEHAGKLLSFLALVFLLLALVYNFLLPRLPRIPGDIYFEKAGFRIYIPFTSALVISALLTAYFNFFR